MPVLLPSVGMATPNTKPYVAAATVCERVLQEPDGVFSASRIVDVLTMKAIPLAKPRNLPAGAQVVDAVQIMDLVLLIMLRAGSVSGEHRIRIALQDPNEKSVPLPLDESPVVLKGNDGVNLTLRFGLPFNAPAGL